jgi:hypothetical protein
MGPGFESQRDHKRSPLRKKRAFLFSTEPSLLEGGKEQKSPSLVKQGGRYAWIEPYLGTRACS